MTVLSIAQNVAKRVGFTAPTSLVNNSDELAVQLLALIKEETRALSDRFPWQALRKRYSFNFVNGTDNYVLPSDFKDYIEKTIWDTTGRRPLIGPISAEEYEIQKDYLITTAVYKMFYIYNDTMYITPTPGDTNTIKYQYTTLNIYKSTLGVGKADITADTDTTTLREYMIELGVKLRFLVTKGIIMPENLKASFEYQDYMDEIARAIKHDGFGRNNPINMNNRGVAWWRAAYTPDSSWPQG